MSPGQGHHATGLCLRFPPIPLSHLHRLSIEQEARTEPPPAVEQLTTANLLSLFQPSFLPHSNSPRRLTTYRTNWLPQRGSGPFQVRCLFHFPHFPSLVPWLPLATPTIFAQQMGLPPEFHPKLPVTIHRPIFPFFPPPDHPVHSLQYRSLNL